MQRMDGEAEHPEARRPRRRGVFGRALRVIGLAGDAADAALDLVHAETQLARAALPHNIGWFCAVLVFGVSLIACGWVAALYGLVAWSGSVGTALTAMAIVSAVFFTLALFMLRRALRWLGFTQTRRRLALLLDRRQE